ncbi:MAG TPA: pseudouridine synthase [Candidatus Saccharimonadales bacterium]|nr:pseudouridine synthase [Candidatus Saccharimonadales bacterium]
MRINRFVAASSDLSRRAADAAIAAGRVLVNGKPPEPGQDITEADSVTLDGQPLRTATRQTILLHKPAGYVTSRNGQGAHTIYELLPAELRHLQAVGRLDKNSSGLLLLTNDGELAQNLTHPSQQKIKIYEVQLSHNLAPLHRQMVSDFGVQLEDGPSKFELERLQEGDDRDWRVRMREGRNRQIRRTFAALGYNVRRLHRTHFGDYQLPPTLRPGKYVLVD